MVEYKYGDGEVHTVVHMHGGSWGGTTLKFGGPPLDARTIKMESRETGAEEIYHRIGDHAYLEGTVAEA